MQIRGAGHEGGDVGACGAGGVKDGGAEVARGERVAQRGGEGGEFGGVAPVQDDVEAVLGEGVGEGFADAVAGAGDEGPGIAGAGVVKVAGEGGRAEVEVDEVGEAEDENGEGQGAEGGEEGCWESHGMDSDDGFEGGLIGGNVKSCPERVWIRWGPIKGICRGVRYSYKTARII